MPAPRVLLVWDEHWPRALLRAQLLEEGYDAIGVPNWALAMRCPTEEPGRGPVRLILIDQALAEQRPPRVVEALRGLHPQAKVVLLARGFGPLPPGRWDRIIRRPVSIGQVVAVVKDLVPLTPAGEGA
ncbi:MAG: hypothetical protein KatS3mg131_3493 [Candidatus Tectimicrobiota bacterium]|nr:MAG: hypothetical protein KatS3mg131_3493 [Candidatus Tectomicrobia bacterium]